MSWDLDSEGKAKWSVIVIFILVASAVGFFFVNDYARAADELRARKISTWKKAASIASVIGFLSSTALLGAFWIIRQMIRPKPPTAPVMI